jgi:hypothetical protein
VPENLVHYSGAPVIEVRSVRQNGEHSGIGKPCGFWLSVDGNEDGWRDWCLGESFGLEHLTHVHDVELAPDAEVLRLHGPAGIDAFTREYHEPSDRFYGRINWSRVAERWQGIIIAPYVWSRRLHDGAKWYYSWDCASGCIWDARAVAGISLREVVPVPVLEPT